MTSATVAKPAGPSIRISVIVLVLGVIVGVVGIVKAVQPIWRTLTSSAVFDTPGTAQMHLGKGKYLVYESTGSAGFGGLSGSDNPTTITADEVTVTGPDGNQVSVAGYTGDSEHLTRNSDEFKGTVTFTTPAAGQYVVRITTPTTRRVLIAHPLISTVEESLPWWGVMVLGAGIAIGGVVMWIVGASRRRKQRLLSSAAGMAGGVSALPPPGWYPDPGQAGRLRYWDGNVWTEHTH